MVECESGKTTSFLLIGLVLIDTWWNVNTLQSPDAKTDSTVLIDTWWNVNFKYESFFQVVKTF